MAKESTSINLLKVGQVNFIDSFFNWALSVGRLVVIVTELIALSAFIYRFSLDRELIDLHTKIKQEQAVIAYLKDQETTYKNLQGKLSIASNFTSFTNNRIRLFSDIIGLAPKDLVFNTITLQETRLRINANLRSASSLTDFVKSLRNHKSIESLSIDKIESKPSSSIITIAITANLREEKNLYAERE